MVEQYLKHSKAILTDGRFKDNPRRKLGRIHIFGYQNRYDLNDGYPLLTTKKMGFKTIAHELIWFLSGSTNLKYLADNNVHIWDDDAFNFNLKGMVKAGVFSAEYEKFSEDWQKTKAEYVRRVKEEPEFAERWGEMGKVYGSQWRHWDMFAPVVVRLQDGTEGRFFLRDPNGIDQINEVIQGMKNDPTSARHIVNAWNAADVKNVALPPCHSFYQLNSDGETLDLQMYQRACDMFLGVPFNIASYSLLTHILANQTGLRVGEFVHTFGDVHFYTGGGERNEWYKNRDNLYQLKVRAREATSPGDYAEILDWLNGVLPAESAAPRDMRGMDHVTGILEQLQRTPGRMPTVEVANKPIDKLTIDDFVLRDYNAQPNIKRALAV